MKKLMLSLLAAAILVAPTMAFAACNCAPSAWTAKTTYGEKALGKLDFAFKNIFGGWTEIFTEPYEAHQAKTNIFKGVGKGLCHGIVDTVGGLLHLVTFPVTGLDVKLPEGGTTIGS